jgi:hypothetical protein
MVLDALFATVRFEQHGDRAYERYMNSDQAAVFLVWHGRLLPATWFHRTKGLATLISRSGDGEIIARIAEHWGYRVIRGSSSRGGHAGLRAMVRVLREGQSVAVTPDGPRGPKRKVKQGALEAARQAGVPILPVGAGTKRAWWFEGWDRFLVPRPFARVHLFYGAPIRVPADAGTEDLERLARQLEHSLDALTEEADAA